MKNPSTIRQLCAFSLQVLLLTAWFPMFVTFSPAQLANTRTAQIERKDEQPVWPMDDWQAELEVANDGQDEATNTSGSVTADSIDTPALPSAVKPASFLLAPHCRMRCFVAAILRERAPPLSHS